MDAATPVLTDLALAILTLVLLPVAFLFFATAYRLLRVYRLDRSDFQQNKERSGTWGDVLRGTTPTVFDGLRDERVIAGVAIDTKTNEWVEQGRLSEEAISNVLR